MVDGLGEVVRRSQKGRGDRLGYFAALYRQVTREIGRAVQREEFQDPRRERFDAAFGNRYFDALDAWRRGRRDDVCPRTWRDAFDACERDNLAVVQHLLLGINAHINVDLAVAAARTAPGPAIAGLEDDFDKVNEILYGVLDQIQAVLNEISPVMRSVDALGHRLDEEVMGFSVRKARGEAWDAAVLLARLTQEPEQERRLIGQLDSKAGTLGRLVVAGGLPLGGSLVARFRTPSTSDVIARLDAPLPPRRPARGRR